MTTAVARSGPTPTTVAAAVATLADELRGRNAEIEALGRLPDDVVAALRRAGVFRLWMPRELGGLEAPPAEVAAIVQQLAEADGSTGWCSATGIASNCAGAFLTEPAARRLFVTGEELCGGALMPGGRASLQDDGSLLVDGHWSFGSGTQHCDWVVGGVVVLADGQPPVGRAVLMPAAEVDFLDTWQVSGLEGTGSVDYEVRGLRVPAEHTIALARMQPWPAGSMWRIPLRSLLFPLLAAVPLGIARRALRELETLSADRTRFGADRRLADQPTVQAAVARCRALIDSGSGYLSLGLQTLGDLAAQGQVPAAGPRAQARLAAAFATENAVEAVTLCYRTAGTTALYRNSPLQRALRDVNAAAQHYALSPHSYQLAGQVQLGFEPDPGL